MIKRKFLQTTTPNPKLHEQARTAGADKNF